MWNLLIGIVIGAIFAEAIRLTVSYFTDKFRIARFIYRVCKIISNWALTKVKGLKKKS